MKKPFVHTTHEKDDRNHGAARRNTRSLLKDIPENEDVPVKKRHGDNLAKKEAMTGTRMGHDKKRRVANGPAYRWLQKNAGKAWNEIRKEFLEKIGNDLELLSELVYEKKSMIGGKLHLATSWGSPTPVDRLYGPQAYVDENGILRWVPKKSYRHNRPETRSLLVDTEGNIWFLSETGLVFKTHESKAVKITETHVTSHNPKILQGYLHISCCKDIPKLTGKSIPTHQIKQISPKKAPGEVFLLKRIQSL